MKYDLKNNLIERYNYSISSKNILEKEIYKYKYDYNNFTIRVTDTSSGNYGQSHFFHISE